VPLRVAKRPCVLASLRDAARAGTLNAGRGGQSAAARGGGSNDVARRPSTIPTEGPALLENFDPALPNKPALVRPPMPIGEPCKRSNHFEKHTDLGCVTVMPASIEPKEGDLRKVAFEFVHNFRIVKPPSPRESARRSVSERHWFEIKLDFFAPPRVRHRGSGERRAGCSVIGQH